MKNLIIAGALVALSIGSTNANDLIAQGAGEHTCAEYLQFRPKFTNLTDAMTGSWAQGFMAGMNFASIIASNQYRNVGRLNADAINAYIYNYCVSHPVVYVTDVIKNLYIEIPLQDMPQTLTEDPTSPAITQIPTVPAKRHR